jgi:hypothetical protein
VGGVLAEDAEGAEFSNLAAVAGALELLSVAEAPTGLRVGAGASRVEKAAELGGIGTDSKATLIGGGGVDFGTSSLSVPPSRLRSARMRRVSCTAQGKRTVCAYC